MVSHSARHEIHMRQ